MSAASERAGSEAEAAAAPVVAPPVLSRQEARALNAPRDWPGLVHLGAQLALGALSFSATAVLGAAGDPLWWVAATLAGIVVLSFFPTLHEAGHQTAFASDFWNEVSVWLGALAMLEGPEFFREFHWEHHRSTQDPEHDPEISGAPGLLSEWPGNLLVYLGLATGQLLMIGKLGFTVACAFLPRRLVLARFPFIREERMGKVVRQCRIVLLILVGATALGFFLVPGFGYVLVAWPIAHLFLGLYLMPEHTGLPQRGSQLEKTRSVRSNPVLRWIMWNMPYHAEHHHLPGVPFHRLPALSGRLGPAVVHRSSGYLAFHGEALRRLF